MADLEKGGGGGGAIQLLGVLAFVVGGAWLWHELTAVPRILFNPTPPMLVLGLGILLLVAGGAAARGVRCSECQTKAPNARARVCTGCGAEFD